MLRMVILPTFLAQLQGLHMETSLAKNVKMENQEDEQKLEYSSQQPQMSPILAMLVKQREVLQGIKEPQKHALEESFYAEEPDAEALKTQKEATEIVRAWADTTKSPDERAELLLAQMSFEEKGNMVHGTCQECPYVGLIPENKRLGIPALNLQDGPQGFRNEPSAIATSTSFPGAMAMAATWDTEAVYQWGVAMGKEFKAKGANVQLGPGVNIARLPQNGRNFEYLAGEDPYLGYMLAGPVVKGIQEQKVIACGKHFVGNSQEANRLEVSEDIDERTLFEVYYPPFQGAIDAGVGSIMCSYNRVNGTYACENPVTLGHLRGVMGFKGFVMSDWDATHSPSLKVGLDMEMPVGVRTNLKALKSTAEMSSAVNKAAFNTLRTMFALGVMDEPAGSWDSDKIAVNASSEAAIAKARQLGAESTVLLKNAGGVLPLPAGRKLAVIGRASRDALWLSFGLGSGRVFPSYYVSPLEGILQAAGPDAEVRYHPGDNLDIARDLALAAEYAVVFVGAVSMETADRSSLFLDEAQNALVSEVCRVNPKTIVVASVPGAFLLPWVNEAAAVLTNFMPGQQAGNAIADVLFGHVNPAARLPVTLPNEIDEIGLKPGQYPGERGPDGLIHAVYSEKLLVGYRHYDALGINFTKGFPFGHGLSYTSFEYTGLSVARNFVSFVVRNAGGMAGREVAQLYLAFPAAAGEPLYQLKGFRKTPVLQPGQEEHITLALTPRDTSVWSTALHAWSPVSGTFTVRVGASSRDIRLVGTMEL